MFSGGAGTATDGQGAVLQEVKHTRENFPETWLWTNVTVGYMRVSQNHYLSYKKRSTCFPNRAFAHYCIHTILKAELAHL
jgi:hypothetical protein